MYAEGVVIKRVGKIEELSQQDYKGKRVYVHITDNNGNLIESKIDLGSRMIKKVQIFIDTLFAVCQCMKI